jgi:hypothetical protein
MGLTVTEAFSVQSPNGNSLAVFIEAQSGEIKLKDVNGKVESFTDYVTASPYRYNATYPNSIEPILGNNSACNAWATIGGGQQNTITFDNQYLGETIAGGYKNSASQGSTVGGGFCNIAFQSSTIAGGSRNCSQSPHATIGGGQLNCAGGWWAVLSGGCRNSSDQNFSTIGGGCCNTNASVNGVIGGGSKNASSATLSAIGGGYQNTVSGFGSVISGGRCNTNSSADSFIGGGFKNTLSANSALIGGGYCNLASSLRSAILGGRNNNTASFSDAMIVGSCLTATQACTTFVNCLSANNLTQNCYVKVGANKVLENSPFAPSTKSVGSFFDTTTQSALLINSPTKMTLNTTDISNNVSVVGGTAITVANAGIYNLQFSAQLFRASGGTTKRIDIWLRKNGTNVPSSDTVLVFSNNTTFQVAAWNFVVDLAAGGNVELMYSVEDLDIKIQYAPENLVVPHPAVPSLIVTMIEV